MYLQPSSPSLKAQPIPSGQSLPAELEPTALGQARVELPLVAAADACNLPGADSKSADEADVNKSQEAASVEDDKDLASSNHSDSEASEDNPTACATCGEPQEFCPVEDCIELNCANTDCEEYDKEFITCCKDCCWSETGPAYCPKHADMLTLCGQCESPYCSNIGSCMDCDQPLCKKCSEYSSCSCGGNTEERLTAYLDDDCYVEHEEYGDEYF